MTETKAAGRSGETVQFTAAQEDAGALNISFAGVERPAANELPLGENRNVRVEIVDALRGVAALAATLYHLTNGNPHFLEDGFVKVAGSYGWIGVDVFFVISGFVLPWSLCRSGYRLRWFWRFVARRIVRLDPPYFVSLVLVLVLAWLSSITPGFAGTPFALEWTRLALHFGYLCGIAGVDWYNPVYWTLAIEVQFYLMIGLLFPLIGSRRNLVAGGTMACLGVTSFLLPDRIMVSYWIFPFLAGMIVFRFRERLMGRSPFLLWLGISIIGSSVTLGPEVGVAVALAALAIAFMSSPPPRVFLWLGSISYSLYLMHVPIGGRVINLADRLSLNFGGKLAAIAVALAASLVAAAIMHRLIEVPAIRWARRVRWPRSVMTAEATT